MKINDIEFFEVKKILNGENSVIINRKRYEIRFTAVTARHIISQEYDQVHRITIEETITLLKNSIVILLPKGQKGKSVALGKHNRKIHELYFIYQAGLITIHTAYICNKTTYRLFYQAYESLR